MPRLLIFAPCLKFIVSDEDKSASWIAVVEGIEVGVPIGSKVPPDAGVPYSWAIATMWYRLPEDTGKEFEQRIQIVWPDGKIVAESTIPFQVTHRTHRNKVTIQNFNIGQEGEQQVRLAIREVGTEWQELADYPIYVKYAEVAEEQVPTAVPSPKHAASRRRKKSV